MEFIGLSIALYIVSLFILRKLLKELFYTSPKS